VPRSVCAAHAAPRGTLSPLTAPATRPVASQALHSAWWRTRRAPRRCCPPRNRRCRRGAPLLLLLLPARALRIAHAGTALRRGGRAALRAAAPHCGAPPARGPAGGRAAAAAGEGP
jgi:hypothetical protein